jgi:hypothetical protein
MMVSMFRDGILNSNHLLSSESFKQKKTCTNWGVIKDHMLPWGVAGNMLLSTHVMASKKRDIDEP